MQSKQALSLFIALVSLITFPLFVSAQTDSTSVPSDTLEIERSEQKADSLLKQNSDSLNEGDTTARASNISKDAIESRINYKARDTIKYDFKNQKVYLYGDAIVTYEDIELKAEYIELRMDSNIVFATGVADSNGKVIGSPVFKEGDQEYSSQRMTYNFKTERGKIDEVITQDGEGVVRGEDVKKLENNVVFIQNGTYSTCDADHQHFQIWAKQLKIIPDDKIIVKPANLIIEDVNTPVIVPFGMFPNRKRGKSGLLVPMPGESVNDGFYLFNGGYYFYLGEKADLEIEGDIYSKGSYAIRPVFNYQKRYKRKGSLKFRHKNTVRGVIPEDPNYSVQKDYWLDWNHQQAQTARPNSNFSAQVNLGTSQSFQNDLNTPDQEFLNGNFSSKISYTQYMLQKKLNLSINARQNQNNATKSMSVTLPEMNLNMQRVFPFKSRRSLGNKWYEKIGLSYNGNFKNEVNIRTDSLAVSAENLDTITSQFRNGIQHSIPLSTNFKVLNHFTLTPSINYRELWYFRSVEKSMDPRDTTVRETINEGFVRGNNMSASASLTTKVYGMMQFRKGFIKAFRHVITPSAGLSYTPENRQGIRTYTDTLRAVPREVEYSIFDNGIYGTPSTNESGKINMSILNSFEMKVKTKTDTGDGSKKIKLMENLKFGTGYDLIKDSLHWDDLSVSGNSNITKQISVNFSSAYDLYALRRDSTGRLYRSKHLEWDHNGRIGRIKNANLGMTFNFRGGSGKKKDKGQDQDDNDDNLDYFDQDQNQGSIRREFAQVDWDVPWNLGLNFSINYTQRLDNQRMELIQEFKPDMQANGDLSLTKNWKLTCNAFIDVEQVRVTYARLGITRNLHCWQMSIDWVPVGTRQSYTFNIGVRANILQDLKLDKRSF